MFFVCYDSSMNIRKFRHACLVLKKDGQSLVIDPGEWTTDFVTPEQVVGVIITHEHGDHLSRQKLKEIIAVNPDAAIYAHPEVTKQLPEFRTVSVTAGETKQIDAFTVRFTGGDHARIIPDKPVCANLGVLVDDGELYYPGDSLVLPNVPIKTLALPVSAPWLKLSEALDFLTAVHPEEVISTHDALLSDEGHTIVEAWVARIADSLGSVTRT
jgi:L-ascorbate metabolism protein UlaG (beta-lactamase superfamily)